MPWHVRLYTLWTESVYIAFSVVHCTLGDVLIGFELGLTPLAQWLAVPPLSLYLARRMFR